MFGRIAQQNHKPSGYWNIGYLSARHPTLNLKNNIPKHRSPISVSQSFSTFAKGMLVTLLCFTQNVKAIEQLWNKLRNVAKFEFKLGFEGLGISYVAHACHLSLQSSRATMNGSLYIAALLVVSVECVISGCPSINNGDKEKFVHSGRNNPYFHIPVDKDSTILMLKMPFNKIPAINLELQHYPLLEVGDAMMEYISSNLHFTSVCVGLIILWIRGP